MIDTLALAQRLRKAEGAPEAIAEAIGHAVNEHAVTRNDLLMLGQQLEAKIAGVGTEITSVRAEVAKSTLTLFVALTGVIAVATALLAILLHH